MVISCTLPANLVLPGALGDIFLGSPDVTLTLAVVPPATTAPIQNATLAVPPVPAFAGLQLHFQGVDLDIATSVLQVSQPASLLLTP